MPGFDRVSSNAPRAGAPFDESSDRSGTFRSVSPTQSLSAKFWGLDLRANLPRVLSHDGVEAAPGEIDRVRAFLAAEFPCLTEEKLGASPNAAMVSSKRSYIQTRCDLIELRHNDRTVGVIVGAPEDWSTYYIRIFAVMQAYQRPALTRRFVRECLFDPLTAHHVERVAADTSPANLAMSRSFSEMHFHVTGHHLSDRWGPLVRYTKFLDPECEAAFYKRFTGIAPPGSSGRKGGKP
jgi:hypothetical protein